ncbi:MAG TPA: type III-B CRISPR module RAMP protein Cmr1, partial [Cyanobacteria bacterium UBA11162]|nr:type III-B CRISPR module RAMP protein Cmr1 [Cyanobacteria bacterium UBA11162]
AYDNDRLMRVWGWVPSQAEVYKNGWDKEKVVKDIHQHLTAKYTLHSWREMKLERDCVTRNESNAQAFLRSLLGLEEGS